VILADNNCPCIVGEEWERYLLQPLNYVPRRLLEIQKTPPHGNPALLCTHEPILLVTMPGVAETVKTVMDEMTNGIDFKLVNLLHAANGNLTHEDLNTSIDEPENRWNIHRVLYDTLTSRAKPSSNGRLSHCAWSFGIFGEFHQYKTKNSVGWRIATNPRIVFKLQLTAKLGFHALHDRCYRTMWLFAGAPEDPEDETVMEMHWADALYSTVKSLMHAIRTEDQDAQQDAAHRMIPISKPWPMSRWSESTLANGKSLVRIPKYNAHLVDLEWNEDEQAQLKPLWRDTLHGVLQEQGWLMDGGSHVSHWYWETPRIGMMFQDNGTMNGHSILEWILRFSDG